MRVIRKNWRRMLVALFITITPLIGWHLPLIESPTNEKNVQSLAQISMIKGVPIIGFTARGETEIRLALNTLQKQNPAIGKLELCLIYRGGGFRDGATARAFGNVHYTFSELSHVSTEQLSNSGIEAEFSRKLDKHHELQSELVKKYKTGMISAEENNLRFAKGFFELLCAVRNMVNYSHDGTDVIEIYVHASDAIKTAPPTDILNVPMLISYTNQAQFVHELAHLLMFEFKNEGLAFLSELIAINRMYSPNFCVEQIETIKDASEAWVSTVALIGNNEMRHKFLWLSKGSNRLLSDPYLPQSYRSEVPALIVVLEKTRPWFEVHEDGAETIAYVLTNQRYRIGRFAQMKVNAARRFLEEINNTGGK